MLTACRVDSCLSAVGYMDRQAKLVLERVRSGRIGQGYGAGSALSGQRVLARGPATTSASVRSRDE